jgi:hypothetical protein
VSGNQNPIDHTVLPMTEPDYPPITEVDVRTLLKLMCARPRHQAALGANPRREGAPGLECTQWARFNCHEILRTSANSHAAWCPLGVTIVSTGPPPMRRPRSCKA